MGKGQGVRGGEDSFLGLEDIGAELDFVGLRVGMSIELVAVLGCSKAFSNGAF